MRRDIAELASGTELRGRVCIIGGGAAGITLARHLASRKIDVVLMESDGLQLEQQMKISSFPNIPDLEPILLRFSHPATRFAQRYRADLEGNANLRCYVHASCLGLATVPET